MYSYILLYYIININKIYTHKPTIKIYKYKKYKKFTNILTWTFKIVKM